MRGPASQRRKQRRRTAHCGASGSTEALTRPAPQSEVPGKPDRTLQPSGRTGVRLNLPSSSKPWLGRTEVEIFASWRGTSGVFNSVCRLRSMAESMAPRPARRKWMGRCSEQNGHIRLISGRPIGRKESHDSHPAAEPCPWGINLDVYRAGLYDGTRRFLTTSAMVGRVLAWVPECS